MSHHLTRRQFLRLAFASSLLGMGSLAYAQHVEPDWIDVAERHLRLPRLDSAFQGYRIVQLSDLHADAWMTPARLETFVALANAQRPDLIAITGDFVTHDPEIYAPSLITALRKLKAPDGVVAILGNHDHWTDADVVRGVFAETIKTLAGGDLPEPLAFRHQRMQRHVLGQETERGAASHAEAIVEIGGLATGLAGKEFHGFPDFGKIPVSQWRYGYACFIMAA